MPDAHLPLLAYVTDLHESVDLSDIAIVACQHLLGTQLALVDELIARGLPPQNLFLIGKSYSTNPRVCDAFRTRGVRVSPLSDAYDSHIAFDNQFSVAATEFLEETIAEIRRLKLERVIVLDVGGGLLSMAEPMMRAFSIPAIGIEQTSSGHRFLRAWTLNFPLIDVARSRAKEWEAVFLAELTSVRMRQYIDQASLQTPRILIVGQGIVGRRLKEVLQPNYEVRSYDRHDSKSYRKGSLIDHIKDVDIVIGATGETVLRANDFSNRGQDLHLISLSSSDREFDAVELRRTLPKTSDPHRDCVLGRVRLLNSGFPLNFDGSEVSLPPHRAQLVVSMILLAIYQASQEALQHGLVELQSSIQQLVLEEFNRLANTS